MDPMEFLSTKDPFRRRLMQAIAHEARRQQQSGDVDRAMMIANEIGKMLQASFSKKS